jgi:hypothetical protein
LAEEVATELGVSLARYYELDQRIDGSWMLSLEQLVVFSEEESAGKQKVSSAGPDPSTAAIPGQGLRGGRRHDQGIPVSSSEAQRGTGTVNARKTASW